MNFIMTKVKFWEQSYEKREWSEGEFMAYGIGTTNIAGQMSIFSTAIIKMKSGKIKNINIENVNIIEE